MKVTKYREALPKGFVFWGEDLDFKRPALGIGENKTTVTRIVNACKNSIVEEDRSIYISTEGFSELLRTTSKHKIKRIISNIDDEEKLSKGIIVNSKSDYVAIGELLKILYKESLEAKDEKRRMYIKVVEEALKNMRECDALRVIAFSNDMKYNDGLKKLKSHRIKRDKIKFDELTGKPLNSKNCEFHHIRSKASYPKLALNIDNGLIVNKDIHDIITKSGAENEEQLEELCIKKGWSTAWLNKYLNLF